MKLSVVIICWNDRTVVLDCLRSIYAETSAFPFEVIVSDNGSTDDSLSSIRATFPQAKVVENGENLGFARGNNAGIRVASGEYVLILNPDTVIHRRALEKLVTFADRHRKAAGFGARVVNVDGSFQRCARPIPTVQGYLIAALYLRWLGRLSDVFLSDVYPGWGGETEREVGFQSGCCVMFRREVLSALGGFDPQFFYHFEEVDLCYRVWKAGHSIVFCPGAEITHLGGQSVSRAPIRFALETYRSRYRFFFKHYGLSGAKQIRWVSLLGLACRLVGYTVLSSIRRRDRERDRAASDKVLFKWNWRLDPAKFVADGTEPDLGYTPVGTHVVVKHAGPSISDNHDLRRNTRADGPVESPSSDAATI